MTTPPDAASAVAESFAKLNAHQHEAVHHDGGPLVVLAGPGAGKTRVIVTRVARLVAPRDDGGLGVDPENVLALAFTIKSAQELRERLDKLVGAAKAQRINAMTCHAFGAKIVHRYGDMIGLPTSTRLMDSAERRRLLHEILPSHRYFRDRAGAGLNRAADDASAFIDQCATDGVSPGALAVWCDEQQAALNDTALDIDDLERAARETQRLEYEALANVYAQFEDERLKRGLLTFDDFINLPARILRESARARTIIHHEYRHIVVDEFQDWSPAQIELLAELAPHRESRPPDLCVVGDDDQAIFAFRGADDQAFRRFRERWPKHRVVTLTENYRSGSEIIAAGNDIIRRAESRFEPDKVVEPAHEGGAASPGVVEGVTLTDDSHHGAAIAAMLLADQKESHRPWSSYAVIARARKMLDDIALELESYDIPINRRIQTSPLQDAAVQDLLAWMRVLVDPYDSASAQRLLARPPVLTDPSRLSGLVKSFKKSGQPFKEFLRAAADGDAALLDLAARYEELATFNTEKSAAETVRRIVELARLVDVESLDPQMRAKRVQAVLAALRFALDKQDRLESPGDLGAFLRHYDQLDQHEQAFDLPSDSRLDRHADEDDETAGDAVALLTAHAAKGLEFDTVFAARVRSPWGFPMPRKNDDAIVLPEALTGRAPTNNADEERRLFYVVCTRAERRLVMLAKSHKREAREGDYFDELTGLATPARPTSNADTWFDRAEMTAPGAEDALDNETPADRARIRREINLVKQRAAAALHRADRAGLSAPELESIAHDLESAGRRLAALAHLRDNGEAPDVLNGLSKDDQALIQELAAKVSKASGVFVPPRAPLQLSYTRITDYEGCPRCWYIKHMLGLDEPKTRSLAVGDVIHTALEKFFLETREAESLGEAVPTIDRAINIATHLYTERSQGEPPTEADLAQLREQLRAALEILHSDQDEILEIERSVSFKLALDSGAHDCIAKIDRIDRMSDGGFRLIDYKTGYGSKKLLEPKDNDLQFCLYALALRKYYEIAEDQPLEGVAEYWVLSEAKRGVISLADLRLDKTLKQINKAAEGMMSGEYERGTGQYGCKGLCELLAL